MKNRRGEIATILTIGTLVIIGATAIVSSFSGINKQKSTSARAECASNTCAGSGTTCLPIGTVSNGLKCCAAHLGQVDHSWATWNSSCKTAANTPIPTLTSSAGCKYPPASCTGTIGTQGNCCAGYICYGSSESTKKCTTQTSTPVPTITPVPTQTGCKTPPMICTDPIGTQGSCCAGYTCYGAGPGFPSRCTAPANTPIPSTTPNPLSSCSKGGQPTIGTQGYSKETCETICGAQNGTYVGPNQQWQEGTQRGCCCTTGNTSSICPQPGLGYACCVQDDRCGTGIRYRWYGCTGQVCSATKIKTQGGPGYLVDCPYGIDKNSNSETGVCSDAVVPPPSAECVDHGSYGLLGGCRDKCKTAGYECTASATDTSGEKRFCCPVAPTVDPTAPSERDAACVAAYGATSYCSTNHICNDPANEEYAPDGGRVTCQDAASNAMNQRCCKPKGAAVDPNATCTKHSCKSLSASYSTLKSYYQKSTAYFSASSCAPEFAYTDLHAVELYCSEGLTTPFDNACREALQDPNAYCPNTNLPLGAEYETTDIKCGLTKTKFCAKKKASADYSQLRCSSIDSSYSSILYVYEKNGEYYKKEGTAYTKYVGNELAVYCSQGAFTPYDNACKQELQDQTAYCPNTNLPLSAEYETTTIKCGLTKTKFCAKKKAGINYTTNPLAPFDNACKAALNDNSAYCPNTNLPFGPEYEKTDIKCGLTKTKFCIKKKTAAPAVAPAEEPIYTVPADVVGVCQGDIVEDFDGMYCLTFDAAGTPILTPYTPPNP